jgi:predicted TIM-barrel fold metal-dependent hydrolase
MTKNNKLKQKSRARRYVSEIQKQMFSNWKVNTNRVLGFLGVTIRFSNQTENQTKKELIKKMTNWQNSQWQKSFKGEPKKRNTLENVEKFAVMVKS